jgi:hypothetical protein
VGLGRPQRWRALPLNLDCQRARLTWMVRAAANTHADELHAARRARLGESFPSWAADRAFVLYQDAAPRAYTNADDDREGRLRAEVSASSR